MKSSAKTPAKIRFLIASGPTREPMDPVRFISNASTGTMGKALVSAAKKRGHQVSWVDCNSEVKTALQLKSSLSHLLPTHDCLIMAAAVCDVRPAYTSVNKIKKENLQSIPLKKNPDILASLSKSKKKGQVFIGFGLESNKILENGYKKLQSKKLELIVLQQVMGKNTPFGDKKIEALFLDGKKKVNRFSSIQKEDLAREIVIRAEQFFAEKASLALSKSA